MNKKDIITIIITTLVIAALIAGCVYLTTRHRSGFHEKKTFGIINSMYQTDGQNIYFSHEKKLMRFNTASDELVKLCTDTRCDGGCILENATYTSRLYRNRFYFSFYGDICGFAYYDIKTAKTHIIKKYNEPVYSEFFVYDGYIYHMLYPVHDENHAVYRLSVKSGKDEMIFSLEPDEYLIMAADGMIFTEKTVIEVIDGNYESPISYSTVYAYDGNTLERRELWHSDKDKYNSIGSRVQFFDGKLYFVIRTDGENQFGSTLSYLCCLDAEIGVAEYLSQTPIRDFHLTREGIYLETNECKDVSTEIGQFGDTMTLIRLERNIRLTDHGGNSIITSYENAGIESYSGYFANGKFLGQVKYTGIDQKTEHFVVIDIESGEIKNITLP